MATEALRREATLTPKPGLVDQRGGGSHADMTVNLLLGSIETIRPGFEAMTRAAWGQPVTLGLREQLARIGRDAEVQMLLATGGVNTHRGAIWALGLLAAAAAVEPSKGDPDSIANVAASIAQLRDRHAPRMPSHGSQVVNRYGGSGAYGEACAAFPHVLLHGLPALRASRARGAGEQAASLDALLAIMSHLPDTCLLYRGGEAALNLAQSGAASVLSVGGMATHAGRKAMQVLDKALLAINVSPGGSADLLAATLFLDTLQRTEHNDAAVKA